METNIFACPICKGALEETAQGFRCAPCARAYPIVDGIPDFFVSETEQDSIDLKSQTWLDPEIAAARDTVYRLCARELKGMAFAMQQVGILSCPGFRILEAGMGTGHFTRWMAEAAAPGERIFAFDFSWPIIARAKANIGDQPGVTIFRANARGRCALPGRELRSHFPAPRPAGRARHTQRGGRVPAAQAGRVAVRGGLGARAL